MGRPNSVPAGHWPRWGRNQGGLPRPGIRKVQTRTAGRWRVFATPYFSCAANHDLVYTGNSAGLHLGDSQSGSDADLLNGDGNSVSDQFGRHAAFNATAKWPLHGRFTGFLARYRSAYHSDWRPCALRREPGRAAARPTYFG